MLILIKATKVIQSRAESDFLLFYCHVRFIRLLSL